VISLTNTVKLCYKVDLANVRCNIKGLIIYLYWWLTTVILSLALTCNKQPVWPPYRNSHASAPVFHNIKEKFFTTTMMLFYIVKTTKVSFLSQVWYTTSFQVPEVSGGSVVSTSQVYVHDITGNIHLFGTNGEWAVLIDW